MSRQQIKVLLIEDNPGDARLIREMIAEGKGIFCVLECVESLAAGSQRITQGDIDLVLLDLGLPDSSGLDTLRRLRTSAPRVPAVVIMSGLGDEEIGVQAVQEGAQDYLVKGQVDSALLLRSIRYAIERSEAENALQQARDELENQVRERTAKLAQAIESLEKENAKRKRVEEELRRHRDHLEELVKERTAELTVAKEQAETANRAKSAFLASMSHELRTPLNAILGYAQILQRRPLDPDIIDNLRTVQRSGEHLLTLITDVLDLAKIEAGRMELIPVPIHFPAFLQDIASIIEARARAKRLSFSFEARTSLPSGVQADETRLRQVLLNLLDNAVKFTEAGHVTLRVGSKEYGAGSKEEPQELAALLPTSYSLLRFEVEDTGVGIAPDQLERIFLPFEQVGDVSRTKGTGLGLAISHQLVQLMGGELHVQSELGRGSLFWFEIALPVIEVAVKVALPLERVITGYKGRRRTVLVADDVPSNRAVLIDLLQPLGFDVVEAADGQQALHLARELQPDLILMDRWMPMLDGFEAAQQMRHIPELKAVPVVAVSASVSKEDQAQSRDAGLDAFLPKPVNWPNLAALLQEHLGLEWEYEETAAEIQPSALSLQPSELTPPPQEELTILHDLARRGNMRAIGEQAAHIETLGEQYVPFAHKLRKLAKGFEERAILALIERYVEKG